MSTYVELVVVDDRGERTTVFHDRDLREFVELARVGNNRALLEQSLETIGYGVISTTAKVMGVDLGWD